MITEKDINEGVRHIDGYRLEAFDTIDCNLAATAKVVKQKRAVVQRLLESYENASFGWADGICNMGWQDDTRRRGKVRHDINIQVRKDCGLGILAYITIAIRILQVAPILWKWWRERQAV